VEDDDEEEAARNAKRPRREVSGRAEHVAELNAWIPEFQKQHGLRGHD
jgi:hypothetical protein